MLIWPCAIFGQNRAGFKKKQLVIRPRNHETLDADFSDEYWETVAGLVLNEMGRIPKPGESITIDGWRITVREVRHHRIARLAFKRVK